MQRCPENWRPPCGCSLTALEPHPDCPVHGYPDPRRCPFCNRFRGRRPCTRCGCAAGLPQPALVAELYQDTGGEG